MWPSRWYYQLDSLYDVHILFSRCYRCHCRRFRNRNQVSALGIRMVFFGAFVSFTFTRYWIWINFNTTVLAHLKYIHTTNIQNVTTKREIKDGSWQKNVPVWLLNKRNWLHAFSHVSKLLYPTGPYIHFAIMPAISVYGAVLVPFIITCKCEIKISQKKCSSHFKRLIPNWRKKCWTHQGANDIKIDQV